MARSGRLESGRRPAFPSESSILRGPADQQETLVKDIGQKTGRRRRGAKKRGEIGEGTIESSDLADCQQNGPLRYIFIPETEKQRARLSPCFYFTCVFSPRLLPCCRLAQQTTFTLEVAPLGAYDKGISTDVAKWTGDPLPSFSLSLSLSLPFLGRSAHGRRFPFYLSSLVALYHGCIHAFSPNEKGEGPGE